MRSWRSHHRCGSPVTRCAALAIAWPAGLIADGLPIASFPWSGPTGRAARARLGSSATSTTSPSMMRRMGTANAYPSGARQPAYYVYADPDLCKSLYVGGS